MASTDEKTLATGPGDERSSPVEGAHGERRRRAHEVLSVQRSHLDRLENELTEQLQQLADEVAQSVSLAESIAGDEGESAALAALQSQFDTLKRQFATLDSENDQLRKQLEEAQFQGGRAEQELRVRDALLNETQANEERRRIELAAAREQSAETEAQLAASRQRQRALETDLADGLERAAAEQEKTKAQRRRIARELKQQRAERNSELDRRKADLHALAQSADAEFEEKMGARLRAQLEQTEAEHAREIEQLKSAAQPAANPAELGDLRHERDELAKRLAAAEAKIKEQASSGVVDATAKSDLQRRFEMAVEELRELKHTNAELESKLKSRGSSAVPAVGGAMDWEAQKQRLLASLEADDDDRAEAVAEHSSIEGTIRITDQIVAQKDQEIAELKELLEQNANALPAATGDPAAIAELLNGDEIIRQEREKLQQAQAEWREKIGQAEVDISVQRAKIARDRSELEGKNRQYQAEQERRANEETGGAGKPAGGRWLARLGLKDIDDSK